MPGTLVVTGFCLWCSACGGASHAGWDSGADAQAETAAPDLPGDPGTESRLEDPGSPEDIASDDGAILDPGVAEPGPPESTDVEETPVEVPVADEARPDNLEDGVSDSSACEPDCEGKECGPDGCGGTCGPPCGAGLECTAHRCQWTASTRELLDQRVGFGRNATGGLGGSTCTVTSLQDSGAHSLRECLSRGNRWVVFAVDGDITLKTDIAVPSNTTVDGRGRYIRLFQKGLHLQQVSNVIITNLIFKEGDGGENNDAIRVIDGSRDVWIHHVSISAYGDGTIDITRKATDVTVSWCKFSNHDKTMLIGASPSDTGDTVIRVTLHHNWFRETQQRHPRLRYGTLHAYNNYYEKWGSYGIGCSQKGFCRSEQNIFEAGENKQAVITKVGDDPEPGNVRSVLDWKRNGAVVNERNRDAVPDPPYPYSPDPADQTLQDRIRSQAGWQ